MKHLLSLALLLLFVTIAKAQTEKGSQTLGLSFNILHYNGNTTSTDNSPNSKQTGTNFGIAPTYSYFLGNKLDIGVNVGYSTSQNSNTVDNSDNSYKASSKGFYSMVRLRKYFLFEDKIGIRTGPFLSYQFNHDKTDQGIFYYQNNTPNYYTVSNDSRRNNYTGGISMDLVYYPTKKIGLAAAIGSLAYDHQTQNTTTSKISTNQFNLSFTNSLEFSVYYIFGG